jgi:hypothetical protein
MLSNLFRIACILAVVSAPRYSWPDEANGLDDPVSKIAACLPKTWKVNLTSIGQDCITRIETDQMATVPSHYSNAKSRIEKQSVIIEFQVLPRHSAAMLKRIREHNEPFVTRLKAASYHSAEWQSIKASMIPFPMFQDTQYGYLVVPPGRVPHDGKKFIILRDVLRQVCSGWEPVEKDGMAVEEIPDYFTYKLPLWLFVGCLSTCCSSAVSLMLTSADLKPNSALCT